VSDIIQLLPDSVANQIAAGEVIQRPASVVKELVENAIDAGATSITINVKDSGRTLIQVIDNGKGMSPTDARMSFERHATSKIRQANDLFAIRTMGFRGEALASIAAVADVELRTRIPGIELGTFIHILASTVQKQETVHCPEGTNFSVKNLFFNIPARRKFLKSNSSELRYIITEFQRIALANPELEFILYHNNSLVYNLTGENVRKRIAALFGKNHLNSLIPVETSTSAIKICGFIGQPKFAKKTMGEQFFFVNGRFMKHPFFHKAVLQAYERILPPDTIPSYFLYFDLDPASIDINIHPTKTEIKFEDEPMLWHMIQASLRESIGKFNLMPSIDFDQAGAIDIPIPPANGDFVNAPEIKINPSYNPFNTPSKSFDDFSNPDRQVSHWETLYKGLESYQERKFSVDPQEVVSTEAVQQTISDYEKLIHESNSFLQFKNKYIITPVKSGLMVIDQKRAHERILYDKFKQVIEFSGSVSQRQLFPVKIELHAADREILLAISEEISSLGFELKEEGFGIFKIEGVPSLLSHLDAKDTILKIIEDFKTKPLDVKEEIKEHLILLLTQSSAINYGIALKPQELSELFNSLFTCQSPAFSPSGKKIISIISFMDFEKLLN
jgi:DNA mismatch repair protein MutL